MTPLTQRTTLSAALDGATSATRALLGACLDGRELAPQDAVTLLGAEGPDLEALRATADEMRRRQAGDVVTYVVNRNINFTNACIKTCHFCAFSRLQRSEEAYFLGEDEIVRRALEARALGATEVCIQAGLAPRMDGRLYVELTRAIKRAAPDLHLHAFSPEEVKYGAKLCGMSFRDYLLELKEAGLDTLPGTSAEILDDAVRHAIAPGRITTAEWIEVITSAHAIGLRTTSTMMFGHIDDAGHRARHLDTLRALQKETGGFSEFVPLSFVHAEAPMYVKSLLPDLRAGATPLEVARLFAVARLMLGPTFKNLQVSWVKQGLAMSRELLDWGANDLGGTLMNESISTSAGAEHGQFVSPARLRALARAAGRPPAERTTLYEIRKRFDLAPAEGEASDELDRIEDAEGRFGSYAQLASDVRFRFRKDRKPVDESR
ncbi:5-amino-6-(D-ribitylamino)uracil--L-tyrosine 4-hydroxyphenyl transferase CofH [Polyangium aurulentum]|uniref:5-amino-6-(D-ribitylamino)uracil--L-tyrosine 4-hydroxyphenyl transferase CofH n=1 Tax=Polyangium aurulentum TaxID=2567896 RepID=UPI0010AE7949|nr:5-amino-6-(D-ribitylamino)uracil--L-tyrosine 4-hydroxyphenyl transferase CofH [Polyangium aurulentum]UQA56595.1 5-amino-6-(D-ribitylamino)uracil--L-tyrosine 4-hydroxyphenyl transferase CofH [Polyangium aurulentum]